MYLLNLLYLSNYINKLNAHPVILEQILIHNNIKCNHLTNYNENREYYLELVMDKYKLHNEPEKNRDEAK